MCIYSYTVINQPKKWTPWLQCVVLAIVLLVSHHFSNREHQRNNHLNFAIGLERLFSGSATAEMTLIDLTCQIVGVICASLLPKL